MVTKETVAGIYNETITTKYQNYQKIFTDGSKTQLGTGYACIINQQYYSGSVNPISSAFTAELFAIKITISTITRIPETTYFLIHVDSLSTLEIIRKANINNVLVQQIRTLLNIINVTKKM